MKKVFVIFGLMVAMSSSSPAADPIKIGAIFSKTGIAAIHNAPLIEMVELAAEEIYQEGGLLGRPVSLIVLDNKSTAIGSILAAENAVRIGVAAVIGAHWSSHSLAAADTLQKAEIPMISTASTDPHITRTGDRILRVCFTDAFQASRKGLELGCLIPDRIPAAITGDVGRLRQSLVNLLSNAVKFTDSGEVMLCAGSRPIPLYQQEDHPDLRNRHLLIVDDNPTNRKPALRLLERLGYGAYVAGNGREVLESLRRQAYDVVLMDVQMPAMDGLEATQSINREWPEELRPRVIAMTAGVMIEDRNACEAAGMDDFAGKPIRVPELVRALSRSSRIKESRGVEAPSATRRRTAQTVRD